MHFPWLLIYRTREVVTNARAKLCKNEKKVTTTDRHMMKPTYHTNLQFCAF